jgi:hypothetical protein
MFYYYKATVKPRIFTSNSLHENVQSILDRFTANGKLDDILGNIFHPFFVFILNYSTGCQRLLNLLAKQKLYNDFFFGSTEV